MKLVLSRLVCSLAATLTLVSLPSLAQAQAAQVIVKFKTGAESLRQQAMGAGSDMAAVRSALAGRASALGARMGRMLAAGAAISDRMQVVRASGISSAELAAKLAADPEVEFAEPNVRMRRLAGGSSEPFFLMGPTLNTRNRTGGPEAGQWYLRPPGTAFPTLTGAGGPQIAVSAINAEAAWQRTAGSANVVVAILDSGIRRNHPEFASQTYLGYDFVDDPTFSGDGNGRDDDASDPGDFVSSAEAATPAFVAAQCTTASSSSWHGTATASLVGAPANGVGMSGVAPGVRLLHVRVLGKCGGDLADITAGMRWAAGLDVPGIPRNPNPAKVLNMSLGGDGACGATYQLAVDEVLAAGATIVVSAGNGSGATVSRPANCVGVVAVAALRHSGTKSLFSSLGAEVAIAAPGANCVNTTGACLFPLIAATNLGSTVPASDGWFDSYLFEYGTSFSAPLVAGVAALMYSVNPNLTPAQVASVLRSSARPFPAIQPGSTLPVCRAPDGLSQDECHCTSNTCGAGMLDAAAAVAAVATATPPSARISVSPASPTAGAVITLNASGSTPGGAAITGYEWTLTQGGGIVSGFTGASNGVTATLTPTAAGSFTVTLAVTDAADNTALASQTVVVAGTPQTISFTSPGNQTLGTAPPALVATASSGLPVGIASGTPAVCTVSGSTLTLIAAGSCTLNASQAGNAVYAAAPAVSQTFTVAAVVTVNAGGGGGGRGGGGATSWPWLALLALAVLRLFREPGRA